MKQLILLLAFLTSFVKAQTLTDSQFLLQQNSPIHKGELSWMHQYDYGDYIFSPLLIIDSTSIRVLSLDNTETNNNNNTRLVGLTTDGTLQPFEVSAISATTQTLVGSNGITVASGVNTFTVSKSKRQETYSGTTNSSGVYTVTFGTSYSVAPNIQANIVGGTANQFLVITSVSTTGFTVNAYQRNAVTLLATELLLASTVNVEGANIDVLITEK